MSRSCSRFIPSAVRSRLASLVVSIATVTALPAAFAPPAQATVTLVSQQRTVTTFATISVPGGESPFCSDQVTSPEAGVFDETVECVLDYQGSHTRATAAQLSYVQPESILAEGSIQAESVIAGDIEFAEGFGGSNFLSRFSVDEVTEIRLLASLLAEDNGRANLTFRTADGPLLIYRSIQMSSEEIDQNFTLDPGTYELNLSISGYGQAISGGGGAPAFASFSSSIAFQTSGIPVPGNPAANGPSASYAPRAVPNPATDATTLFASSGSRAAGRDLRVVSPEGRIVRRFSTVGPDGVLWDGRDEEGRLLPAGVYLLRGGEGRSGRVTLMR